MLCMEARLTPVAFQKLTGISRRTFYRWQDTPPPWAVLLCKLLSGQLGRVHENWSGWTISTIGELCSPENTIFTPGELRSWFFRYEQIRAFKIENEILRKRLKSELMEQPLPREQISVETIQQIFLLNIIF